MCAGAGFDISGGEVDIYMGYYGARIGIDYGGKEYTYMQRPKDQEDRDNNLLAKEFILNAPQELLAEIILGAIDNGDEE